ncbi:hypothetical protein B296_00014490 [Ensete ventricosum]|uniref:Uncharacterized protein n=1 Tax=Ensete ventricosum TaxID=4639 RepID=A0A426Y358_ENSVE|nr:hypothetical protein B296_00014490 [Ensete ventricosum]
MPEAVRLGGTELPMTGWLFLPPPPLLLHFLQPSLPSCRCHVYNVCCHRCCFQVSESSSAASASSTSTEATVYRSAGRGVSCWACYLLPPSSCTYLYIA